MPTPKAYYIGKTANCCV